MYLTHLKVKNYALIDELELELAPGLNILSGETGAGKSIILESFALVLGEKIRPETIIRQKEDVCQVIAEFRGEMNRELKNILKSYELLPESEELIFRRIIEASSRGRILLNETPVSLATLSAIGDYLVDIHGQHQHQSLLKNNLQRQFLDEYAGNEKLLAELGEKYILWRNKEKELATSEMSVAERQRQIDLYQYQIKEITTAKLKEGEEEELRRKLPEIKNAAKIKEITTQIYSVLAQQENSVLEQMEKILRLLDNLAQYTSRFSNETTSLKENIPQLRELSYSVREFAEKITAEPETLDEIYQRLDKIENLKKKYGANLKEINNYYAEIKQKLEGLLNYDDRRQEIIAEIKKYQEEVKNICQKLTRRRQEVGEKLSATIEKEIQQLGMPRARFVIKLVPQEEIGPFGRENVEFLFSANPGQDILPLRLIASGGELSRVMLAIKTAATTDVPILVFDEIDVGLSGPIGAVIGQKLKKLAGHKQVICITHLPQIAAYADAHFLVEKITKTKETKVKIERLSEEKRIGEIARMISGQKISAAAVSQAKELLAESKNA